MAWIDPTYKTGNCKENSFVRDSTGKGYYGKLSPTVTGSSESYAVKNIYDLAGNVDEWTLETTPVNDYPCNIRGGAFGSAGSSATISNRYRYKTYYNYYATGFRATLY